MLLACPEVKRFKSAIQAPDYRSCTVHARFFPVTVMARVRHIDVGSHSHREMTGAQKAGYLLGASVTNRDKTHPLWLVLFCSASVGDIKVVGHKHYVFTLHLIHLWVLWLQGREFRLESVKAPSVYIHTLSHRG